MQSIVGDRELGMSVCFLGNLFLIRDEKVFLAVTANIVAFGTGI